MAEPTPDVNTGRATPAALVPLWSWLAILTVSIALFFHLASQGSPWTLEFGLKPTSDSDIAKSLAGLWGLLFLLPSTIALYLLTLSWMARRYAHAPTPDRWDRLPAPEFWTLPVTDPITRTLRVGVWLLVFALPQFTLGHLTLKHFGAEFFQRCRYLPEDELGPCLQVSNGALKLDDQKNVVPLPPNPSPEQLKDAVRPFAQGSDWQRFVDHIHLKHLHAPKYFDHSFYFSKPSGPTYFPGLQAWVYLAGLLVVAWLWLRIVLSWVFRRMVFTSPWATVRRLMLFRFLAKAKAPSGAEALPPAQIRVGVIGHRKLTKDQRTKVDDFLTTVLPRCERTGYGLRIVCGMAAGADRVAAQWVIDRVSGKFPATGALGSMELLLLLPGQHEAFRDHGIVDDPSDFDDQYTSAKALEQTGRVRVLALPGIFDRHQDPALKNTSLPHEQWQAQKAQEDVIDAPHRALRIAAHRYKTDVLLRQCEFLVAVMTLSDSGKPGGTRECVEQALALGTPVLVLDIDSGQSGLVTRVDQLRPGGLPPGTAIDAFIAELDRLPKLVDGIPADLSLLAGIYRPSAPPWTDRLSLWWSYFEAWFASPNGPDPSSAVVAKKDANPARLGESTTNAAPQLQNTKEAQNPEKAENTFFGRLRSRVTSQQRALMSGYRGAFVLAYGLGLFAVTLALSIVLLLWFWPPKTTASLIVLATLTFIKFGVVLTIGKLIRDLGPQRTPKGDASKAEPTSVNDMAVALRYVSERLRIMPTMVKLGCARMDLLHQSQRMGDTASVAEDLCRRIPLATLAEEIDTSTGANRALDWLQKEQNVQVSYNENSSTKFKRIHHRLESIVKTASRALIIIIAADLIVLLLKAAEKRELLPSIPVLMDIGLILVVMTAFLPALMATCNALLFQTQCEQLAEREQELAKTFRQHSKATDALRAQIQAGLVAAPVAAAVLAESERTAAVLAEEVAEWAVMSRQQAKEV